VTENTFACMKAAYDVGINFFDCAEGYAGGESERVMGEAIKKFGWKRNDLVVSTKVRGSHFSSSLFQGTGRQRGHAP
jgi:aryl-alcohol dehydrogenase-like predicted oxidoreductase